MSAFEVGVFSRCFLDAHDGFVAAIGDGLAVFPMREPWKNSVKTFGEAPIGSGLEA